ncbi:MAG: putative membrane protein [Halobacteriales archaeon]|jgi:uncharacterized membrane protein
MRAPRVVVALLASSLLFAGVLVPAAASSDGSAVTASLQDDSNTSAIERPTPHTIIAINVTETGDARWTVTSQFTVETQNETAAFQSLATSVKTGDSEVGYRIETFRRAANLSERSTDREMAIENVSWTSRIENDTGSLSLQFTWSNFARMEDDSLVVDDVFSSNGGTWFPRLNDGQKLVINPPGEYAPIDTPSDRGPVNGSLIWEGPRDFEPGYFSIVYVASIGPGTTTTSNQTTATSTQTTTTPGGPTQETSPTFWMGVVLLVFAVGAGGYFYAVHRRDGTPTAGGAVETDSEEGEDESAQAIDTEDVSTRETSGETSASTVPPTESAMGSGPGTEEPMTLETDTGIDPELLSDEERVERLLERNGGRMKQANIVTETGWSNAKVSQLLSSMAEEDRINKLRIGRENLITLPDEDVTDF